MTVNVRVRSPRYPSLSLQEAERMAKAIFAKDGMNAVDRESAVQHIGYSSLNGASATALASLKQYGLTEDAGKGMLKLTKLTLDLIEPESERSRSDALLAAAFAPDLFASLREKFPEKVPSQSNLRAYLLRQEFTSAAVKSIVPAYLETCDYVTSPEVSERSGHPEKMVQESNYRTKMEAPNMTISPQANEFETDAPPAGRRMVFDTEEGEVMFTYPDNLSGESVQDIEEWFALVAKRLRRASKT